MAPGILKGIKLWYSVYLAPCNLRRIKWSVKKIVPVQAWSLKIRLKTDAKINKNKTIERCTMLKNVSTVSSTTSLRSKQNCSDKKSRNKRTEFVVSQMKIMKQVTWNLPIGRRVEHILLYKYIIFTDTYSTDIQGERLSKLKYQLQTSSHVLAGDDDDESLLGIAFYVLNLIKLGMKYHLIINCRTAETTNLSKLIQHKDHIFKTLNIYASYRIPTKSKVCGLLINQRNILHSRETHQTNFRRIRQL